MKLKNLIEARYSSNKAYFISCWDAEDGYIDIDIGPLSSKQEAKKVRAALLKHQKDYMVRQGGVEVYEDLLPDFHIKELTSNIEQSFKELEEHMDVFIN